MYYDWILFGVGTWCWSGDKPSPDPKITQLWWWFYAPPGIVDHNKWHIIRWSRKNPYKIITLKVDVKTEHVSCWTIECAWYAWRVITLIHVSPTVIFKFHLISVCNRVTVGQRKKVTAVTFFPARPRPDQRGTNTGQIRKVHVNEIAWFFGV